MVARKQALNWNRETTSPEGVRDLPLRSRVYRILEPSSDGDVLSRIVDIALISLIIANVLAVVVGSMERVSSTYGDWLWGFEVFSVIVFTLEYLARLWTCSEHDRGNPHPSRYPRLRFIASPMALVDLAAVLPFYLSSAGLLAGVDMRILRALRLIRVFKLTRYSRSATLLLTVLKENARNFGVVFALLVVIMLIAASGMHLFEREVQPEAFGSIPASMWWAFATLTTVGYGDVTPVTVGGKVFGAMITVVSVGIVALPAGLLASSFSERLHLRSFNYRKRADQAWEDGVLSVAERQQLEEDRIALGLGEDLAETIIMSEARTRGGATARCPHCGGPL